MHSAIPEGITVKIRFCFGSLVGISAASLLLSAPVAAADQAPDTAPVQAIWKPQNIDFYYQSFTTFYSCTSLTDKVKRLLIELGASADIKVRTSGCSGNEIARMPHVRIKLSSPVEATAAVMAEMEKTRSTRELAARVRGERAAGTESADQFPARWQRVSLSRGALNLESGDCDLIEELKRKVLPRLAIRVVQDDMSCAPNQLTLGQPKLEVEALTEVPEQEAADPQQ